MTRYVIRRNTADVSLRGIPRRWEAATACEAALQRLVQAAAGRPPPSIARPFTGEAYDDHRAAFAVV